ncbi:hypothetical protein NP493_53g02000 [Ridgeia piscesae]|uniref:Uncharacterized protein n=1 Tax=Ridgeia piscesae TaxID=27915 RepID=A0AAD9PB30_RIDPI|nr:hypothetical protein NP493_53g02000 [Ridgeia piscesae]
MNLEPNIVNATSRKLLPMKTVTAALRCNKPET